MIRILYNPYSGVDWNTTPRVKAVSHEHVYAARMVARMYDRGIRFFAHVHYQPAVPRVPLSDIDGTFEDWNYYDVTYVSGNNFDNVVDARKNTPDTLNNGQMVCNFKQSGLIVAYQDSNGVQHWTKLIRNLSTDETWNECCEDETAWTDIATNEDMKANLTKHQRTLAYSIPTFQSAADVSVYNGGIPSIAFEGDGEEHNTDDFPQIPNAEHTLFRPLGHFNVLGSRASEPAWSLGAPNSFRYSNPLYGINDIATVFPNSSSFYDNKLFGSQNHDASVAQYKQLQDKYPWFKGLEIYNNGMQRSDNASYLTSFHQLLNDGRTVFALAVCDWQGDYNGTSDVDGGTNVLYLPSDYASMSVANKSKAGMDAYMNGCFVASRFGSRHILDFSVNTASRTATFKVSDTAKELSLVFNGVKHTINNASEVTASIPRSTTNITAEAWFAGENSQIWKSETKLADSADFIFTQAIILESEKTGMSDALVMYALDK